MEYKRKIKLFFVYYGRLLLYIIGIIVGIIFIIQGMNKYVKEQKKKIEPIEQEKIVAEEKKVQDINNREKISSFIELCKSDEIEESYSMITDSCKQDKFKNIDEFKKYYKNYFGIKISDYKIKNENDLYIITLVEDMLATGKIDSTKQIKMKINNIDGKISIID